MSLMNLLLSNELICFVFSRESAISRLREFFFTGTSSSAALAACDESGTTVNNLDDSMYSSL